MRGMPRWRFWSGRVATWRRSDESFDVALAVTRGGNVFTTHTPVAAGFDRFPANLVRAVLRHYAKKELGVRRGRSSRARPP